MSRLEGEPDLARAVAFAREARAVEREARGVRVSRPFARTAAVLGLIALATATIGGFSAVHEHDARRPASLVAAADIPAARIREVDVMRKSSLAVVGAVMVATGASAGGKGDGVPPGWTVVADVKAQFSNIQGQDGWSYHFDRGDGTTLSPMPHFANGSESIFEQGWCTATTIGLSGSYCSIFKKPDGDVVMHPNSPNNCNQTGPGLQRPILRWTNTELKRIQIVLRAAWYMTTGHNARLRLSSDGALLLDRTLLEAQGLPIEAVFELPTAQVIELLEDPTGDGCHADGVKIELLVLAPDCNGDSVPDAVEISTGAASDVNLDDIPDSCQCLQDIVENGIIDGADLAALLSVWGTDGGIYPRSDVNRDGSVDGADLAAVLSGWGACP